MQATSALSIIPTSPELALDDNSTTTNSSPPPEKNIVFFKYHRVQFRAELASKLPAIYCKKDHLINEIVQCPDGDLLCRQCLVHEQQTQITEQLRCPEHHTGVFEDNFIARDIKLNYPGKCPSNTTYKNSVCPWHGPIDEILDHLDTCSNIPPKDLLTMTQHAHSEDAKIIKTLARRVAKLETIIEKIPKQSMVSTEHSGNSSASMSPEIQQRLAVLEQRDARNFRIIATLENEIAALKFGNGNLAALPATTRTHSASSLRYTPSTDGTLSWRIEGFSQKMHEAKSSVETKPLYSPIFYSHKGGYKLCTKAYLNGDGMGHKTHISLFLIILKGENDNALTWPFSHLVTFKLINQEDQKDNKTDSFRPDPASNSFHKPINDANIASGCPLFLAQTSLRKGFVLNDTIYIETIVEKG